MINGISGFEKFVIALTALIIAKRAIENPQQAKGCLMMITIYFIFLFFVILIIGTILQIGDLINSIPLKQMPGESPQHRAYRQWLKNEGYGPDVYEYKNNP
jgi:hypothetical protein